MFDTPEIISLIIVLFAVVGTGFYFSMTTGERHPFNPHPQTLDDDEREAFYRPDRGGPDDPLPIRGTDHVPAVSDRAWDDAGFGPGGSQAPMKFVRARDLSKTLVKVPDRPLAPVMAPIDDGHDPRQLAIDSRRFNVSLPVEVVHMEVPYEAIPVCPICNVLIAGRAMIGTMQSPTTGLMLVALIHENCGQKFKPGTTVRTEKTFDEITDDNPPLRISRGSDINGDTGL